jgi:hypothetical protein
MDQRNFRLAQHDFELAFLNVFTQLTHKDSPEWWSVLAELARLLMRSSPSLMSWKSIRSFPCAFDTALLSRKPLGWMSGAQLGARSELPEAQSAVGEGLATRAGAHPPHPSAGLHAASRIGPCAPAGIASGRPCLGAAPGQGWGFQPSCRWLLPLPPSAGLLCLPSPEPCSSST